MKRTVMNLSQAVADTAEYVADLRAEQGQNGDDDNSYQYKNQSILDQTLAFFTM
jgi:hypothetical protein